MTMTLMVMIMNIIKEKKMLVNIIPEHNLLIILGNIGPIGLYILNVNNNK